MLRKWLVLCVPGAAILLAGMLAGCRRDSVPEREEFSGVIAEDGRAFAPIRLTPRKGDSILGPAAAEPAPIEAPGAGRDGEVAEEVEVDTTSAEATANSLVAVMQSGDLSKLPDLVPADQSDAMREMVAAYGPLAKAARQLKLALDAKFPDHDIEGFFPISQTLGSLVAAELKVAEIKEASDEEATAVLAAGQTEDEVKQVEVTLKKAEESWRVVLPDFAPPPDIAAAAEQDAGKDAALADIARRVESGDLADVEAVKAALAEVAAGTYQAQAGDAEPAEGQPGEDQPEAAPAAEPATRSGGGRRGVFRPRYAAKSAVSPLFVVGSWSIGQLHVTQATAAHRIQGCGAARI